jgi:hypothetical protein
VRQADTSQPEDPSDQTLEILQWRSAVKLMQHEEAEQKAGIDRQFHLNLGKAYLVEKAHRQKKSSMFTKSRRLCYKLFLPGISKALASPCHKHGKEHTCLNAFRSQPGLVLRWRKMWFALPKEDRDERLRRMFAEARQKHQDGGDDDDTFKMQFQVFGVKLCRDAFIRITGIHADTLQRARKAAMGGLALASSAGVWRERRAVSYLACRAWLLNYAQKHADSSPLNNKLWLPYARKYVFWSAYWHEETSAGKDPSQIAQLSHFLKMWRTELPWIKIRPTSGPFTHCGLCDFLKMLITSATDKALKNELNLRLGEHFQFQGAQRVAMSNIFRESEDDPDDLLAVSWDKMDQAKTIVPRIAPLSSTQFVKGGSRLVVSLIGVLAPCLCRSPLIYTILEDQVHGSDMIASLMVDVVQEAVKTRGVIPRRLFFQADNTRKETKNTICLFAACWLMIHLRGTRLQRIEFGYLVVGHTHDLVDAMFAYISKALVGKSFLCLPHIWKHLRDIYKECQPPELSSQRVKGISQPNHVRLFWSRDGSKIIVQSKHWLTSSDWSEPLVLLDQGQVMKVSYLWPGIMQPHWDESFQSSSLAWFEKLRGLLHESGHNIDGIDHCIRLLKHEDVSFLPSGLSLSDRIAQILQSSASGKKVFLKFGDTGLSDGLRAAMSAAFPGSSGHCRSGTTGLLQIGGARSAGDSGFCQDELETDMLLLFRNHVKQGPFRSDILPFGLGKVLRISRENPSNPCVFLERWLPVPKAKYDEANMFGKWQPDDGAAAAKRRAGDLKLLAISLEDCLAWPVDLETKGGNEIGKIPLPAFHFLREAGHMDVSSKKYTFSKRGKAFFLQVAKRTAQYLRDADV